jgi:hypothetical protein
VGLSLGTYGIVGISVWLFFGYPGLHWVLEKIRRTLSALASLFAKLGEQLQHREERPKEEDVEQDNIEGKLKEEDVEQGNIEGFISGK